MTGGLITNYISKGTGAPGSPPSIPTGENAVYVDETNDNFWFWDSTAAAWKGGLVAPGATQYTCTPTLFVNTTWVRQPAVTKVYGVGSLASPTITSGGIVVPLPGVYRTTAFVNLGAAGAGGFYIGFEITGATPGTIVECTTLATEDIRRSFTYEFDLASSDRVALSLFSGGGSVSFGSQPTPVTVALQLSRVA